MLHSARHRQYQGKLFLNNIPLISSCTSLWYTLAHPQEAWHNCTQAREQITAELKQWAILTHEKEWKKKESKEMCMEIPVIVLDHEGEVAFWSKLTGAGWAALDIWPDWNSPFEGKLPSWKISNGLTDPAPSFSSFPLLSASLCICLPSFPLLSLFSPPWRGQVPGRGPPIAALCLVFPTADEENKTHTKSSYPRCTETGQTTARSQNKHEKRREQSKALAGMGRERLRRGFLKDLKDIVSAALTAALPCCWVPPLKIRPACALWGVERIMTLCQWANTHTCINHPSCLAVNYSCLPSE